ncbi:hypothetical protein POM88_028707 [Heracleum sosnowskyi]|uniref:Uncharacterized protein n=1 Tax=Heracleum sosnowskyi TaxID=360622 RepID=A0AAD8MGZ7_9APIA|nr:hypothetical protein POM88_028707 [Heracleum sosnowskyi]
MKEKSGEREGTTGVIREEAAIASELMGVSEGERELTFQEHYQQTLDSISLDPETFTHPVPAYQVMAQQGNVEAKSFGDNLQVATTSQTGTYVVPPRPNWLSQDMQERCTLDAAITRQYNEAYLAHESANARDKKFYKTIMNSLEIQRLQMLLTRIEATEIKDSISNLRDATDRRLDEKLPLLTVSKMNRFFSKEPEVSSSLKTLSSRVDKVEATLSHMQKEQEKQTQLLTQLLAAQGLPIILLDDNKKGEKSKELENSKELDIQITKVLVPAISLRNEPLAMGELGQKKKDGIDLIQEASMRMRLAEQIKDHWSNIEARVKKIAGTAKNSNPSTDQPSTDAMVVTSTEWEPQFKSSYVIEPLQHGVLQDSRSEKGQSSCFRNVDARGISPISPVKPKGKNIARIFYPPPKPDEFKVLGKLIIESKESNHPSMRNKRAIIYRDSKEICIWEEKAKDEAKEAGKERKSVRQPKARAKRNLNFDKDDSQDTAQDSSITSAHQIPVDLPHEGKLACDPAHPVNFHDQPIMPKEEPLEFDEAYFPKFLFEKDQPMKTKKRAVKANPVFVRKPQPQKPPANPEDCMYIADIREESSLHLDLDNLVDVRGIAASQKLPERLVFTFKGGREQVWPLYRILGEDYQTLLSVFRCLKKDFGFTKTAKSEVVSKICQIKASWNKPEALPRMLRVPSTGKKIHLQPYWMTEFKDKDNCRRFFRMEDQLDKASNQTLKFMQSMLGDQDEEDKIFYRRLQVQIQENNSKRGKKTMPQRRHI